MVVHAEGVGMCMLVHAEGWGCVCWCMLRGGDVYVGAC